MGQIFAGIFLALLLSAPVIGAQDDGNRMAVIAAEFKSAIKGMMPQEVAGVANEYLSKTELLRNEFEEGTPEYAAYQHTYIVTGMGVYDALEEYGDSLSHYAVRIGDVDMVETMIGNYILPTFCRINKEGHQTTSNHEERSLSFIYWRAGSNLHKDDNDGKTPLHYAVQADDDDMVAVLLGREIEIEVDVNGHCDGQTEPSHAVYTVRTTLYVDAKDSVGQTPLHIVARMGNTDIASMLLNAGADPNIRDSNGWTPMDYAVQVDDRDMVAMLSHQ